MSTADSRSDWADPSALGFAPLAGINIVFAGVFLQWWGTEAYLPLVAVVGFVGGICQLLTGLITLRRDDACGGTLMAAFGMMFMWGPGMMLVMKVLGVAGALDPLFGAWNLFLGVLLATWSIALITKPWFEFLIGPYGGLTLVAAGLHHLLGLDAVIPGILFLGLFVWGMYMLVHSLGQMSGLDVPLGRPMTAILGFAGESTQASTSVSRSD